MGATTMDVIVVDYLRVMCEVNIIAVLINFYGECSLKEITIPPTNIFMVLLNIIVHIYIEGRVYGVSTIKMFISTKHRMVLWPSNAMVGG